MSSTVITKTGLAAAARAGMYGPEIRITGVKIGNNLITPNSSMTDVSGLVWSGGPESILYQVANESTVIFKITLDQTVGDFDIGNIGLYLESGELFCITGLPAKSFKQKQALPEAAGNRRVFNIPIVLSGIATITDLSILIADEANVPTVNTELQLPDPLTAPYSVYEVLNHTQFGVPVLALRVDSNWWFVPSQLAGGQGYQFSSEDFDLIDPPLVGDAVRYNPETRLFEKANGFLIENGYIGFRGENNSIITTGIYKNQFSTIETPSYVAGVKYYADGGINKGRLTTTPTAWYVGLAVSYNQLLLDSQNINIATESYPGNIQIATVEETINGTVRDKAVTPYTLARVGNIRPNEFSNGQFFLQNTTNNTVTDWNTLKSGTSVFGLSFIGHSRDSWLEGPSNYVRLRHSTLDETQLVPSKFYQRVPHASRMQTQTKCMSFRARGSVIGMTVAVGGTINFGTGGAPSAAINLPTSNIVLTTEWQTYEVTFDIPQMVGVYTFGSNNDDYIEYFLGVFPNSLNYIDVDWIKLEVGSFASAIVASTPEFCTQNRAQYVYYPWTFTKNVAFNSGINTAGTSNLSGTINISGNTTYSGTTTFNNTATFSKEVNLNGTTTFGGATVFNSTSRFVGVATFNQIIEGTARKALWA